MSDDIEKEDSLENPFHHSYDPWYIGNSFSGFFENHRHINHVHFPPFETRRTYEPWYDDKENFNLNAKSYYDYLGRFNGFLYEMVEQTNRLLRRNIKVKNTKSIDFHKDGDWIDNGDCKTKFDDIELLYANVILSTFERVLTYTHIHRLTKQYTLKNATVILDDGVYTPDYLPVLNEIDLDLGEIHDQLDNLQKQIDDINNTIDDLNNKIGDLTNELNDLKNNQVDGDGLQSQIDEIKNNMPSGYTTLVTTPLWRGAAHGGDVITVSEPINNFDLVRVSFNIGASQFTSDIIPGLFASTNPEIVKFSGWDVAEPVLIFARTGMRCSDSSFKSLNVEQSVNYLRYVNESTGSITLLEKGAGANGKTGNATISKIEGVKAITYNWKK